MKYIVRFIFTIGILLTLYFAIVGLFYWMIGGVLLFGTLYLLDKLSKFWQSRKNRSIYGDSLRHDVKFKKY